MYADDNTVRLSTEGARVGRYNPEDYIVMGFDTLMDCLIVKKRRKFNWMKHVRRSELKAQIVSEGEELTPRVGTLEDMGMVYIKDAYADYDTGGRFVVLETVTDLEWAIIDTETSSTMKLVPLDFDEAKRYCDEYNDSTERNE